MYVHLHIQVQTKDYKIGIYCFSAKHGAVRKKWQKLINFKGE